MLNKIYFCIYQLLREPHAFASFVICMAISLYELFLFEVFDSILIHHGKTDKKLPMVWRPPSGLFIYNGWQSIMLFCCLKKLLTVWRCSRQRCSLAYAAGSLNTASGAACLLSVSHLYIQSYVLYST